MIPSGMSELTQQVLLARSQAIKSHATTLGFDLVGIAAAVATDHANYVRSFLATGQHGDMHYLASRLEERLDPAVYLPGARAAVCVAINYHVPLTPADQELESPARIARYALGDDYHEVLKAKLHRLADFIRQLDPSAVTKAAVDTAPVLERELAARSGIGWVGKNTLLIHPRLGSYFFLGEVITTAELALDSAMPDRCGTCTRCLDACPTGAFPAPYQMDASKCISYLTIEHRSAIRPELEERMDNWLYGCDICQEVCPWNSRAPTSHEEAFRPRWPSGTVSATAVASWSSEEYRSQLRHSAMRRVKLPVLQQSATRIARKYL